MISHTGRTGQGVKTIMNACWLVVSHLVLFAPLLEVCLYFTCKQINAVCNCCDWSFQLPLFSWNMLEVLKLDLNTGICVTTCANGHGGCRYVVLTSGRLMLLCLQSCLLYAICMTDCYSCRWLGLKLLKRAVITLFAVLLVISACVCCDWSCRLVVLVLVCSMAVTTKSTGFLLVLA